MVTRRAWFWAGLLVVLALLLWLLRSVLLPFVLGMAIAYFVDPLVRLLERRGLSRGSAAAGIITGFFAIATAAFFVFLPVILDQTSALASRLPALFVWARDAALPWVQAAFVRLRIPLPEGLAEPSPEVMRRLASLATSVVGGLLSGGLAVVNVVALLSVTPLVAFYLLRDWPRVVAEVDDWLPRDHAADIREQVGKIDAVLAGFARGSAIVCLVQALFYAIALTAVGLEFGFVIGLSAGLVSFIPYVGALFGFLSSVGVGLYQFWPDWVRVLAVGSIFFAGQFLQDYLLTPRLVGDQVGLHPLWVIFGVLAGGALFGFVGVLLAVPACAVIGVLVRWALARYKTSPLYLGEGGA